jgi:hypothetical protein
MADLNDKDSAQSVKLVGADASGIETNYIDATVNGIKVDGSAVTQPISAISLPLPSGAATAANQAISNSYASSLIGEETYNLTGILTTTATTADQQIIAYTVPVGKVLYLLGWSIFTGNSGATVVKIGKNTPLTETTNPGTTTGNVFRAFGLQDASRDSADYAIPRKYAVAGDVIKMTVTPSKSGSTTWRASIDFMLRDV